MVPLKYFAEYVYTSRKTLKINIQYIHTYIRTYEQKASKKREKDNATEIIDLNKRRIGRILFMDSQTPRLQAED